MVPVTFHPFVAFNPFHCVNVLSTPCQLRPLGILCILSQDRVCLNRNAALPCPPSCHPLLVMDNLVRERVDERSKCIVPPSVIPKANIVARSNANERFLVTSKRGKERGAYLVSIRRDNMVTRKQIDRYPNREIVLPSKPCGKTDQRSPDHRMASVSPHAQPFSLSPIHFINPGTIPGTHDSGDTRFRGHTIPGTRTDFGRLSNFDGRPDFPGRSLRPTVRSRRSTNVALPKG